MRLPFFAALLFSIAATVFSFVPPTLLCFNLRRASKPLPLRSSQRVAFLASSSSDELVDSDDAPVQDLRSFLTQRCIQSFMYLLASTRDPHTIKWLDNFTQPITGDLADAFNGTGANPGVADSFRENDKNLGSKLLAYHGLSALNTTLFPTWDSYFRGLLEQPDTTLLIKTPEEVGRRAYSEFDIDIEPARLCSRILSVREQIAKEWTNDLNAIKNMGSDILNSYQENAKMRRNQQQGTSSNETTPFGFDRPSQFFLEFDPQFDAAYAPSPLRKGNFDLLYNLITQESVRRVLDGGVDVGDLRTQMACTAFLQAFYKTREFYFTGNQWYGRADNFIEELMLSPSIMISQESEEGVEEAPLLVEPVRIAEEILNVRDKLATEWIEITERVPKEHMEIRKLQLSRMMGETKAEVSSDDGDTKLEVSSDDFQ